MRLLALILAVTLGVSTGAAAQTQAEIWRSFAEKIKVGSEVDVRLQDGQRFRATLLGTRDDGLLLQPRTRVTVPVQAVPYEAIARMEPRAEGKGMGAGKAAAIGVASGVGTFFAIMAIIFAVVED